MLGMRGGTGAQLPAEGPPPDVGRCLAVAYRAATGFNPPCIHNGITGWGAWAHARARAPCTAAAAGAGTGAVHPDAASHNTMQTKGQESRGSP